MPDQHVDIASLGAGMDIVSFYLCKSIEQKSTKAGQPYVQAMLADKTGTIDARIWGRGLDAFPGVEPGIVVKVQGTTETYQDKLQLKVSKLRGATDLDGVVKRDLMRMSPEDPAVYLDDITEAIHAHCSAPLSEILCIIINAHHDELLESPAAMMLHHPYIGGLCQHIHGLVSASVWCAESYGLNKEVLIAIAVLHDIGKVVELDESGYTEAGRMFGHINIGANIWREAWSQSGCDDHDLFNSVLHGILSHHGSLEHGSPVVPCTKEAIAFHHLDMLDSRMSMYDEAIIADQGTADFTGFNKNFGGYLKKP